MPKEILIVDDEPSIVVPIQFLMEQQGYNVIVAVNGEDALDIILKSKNLDKRENGNVILVAPATELAAQEAQELEAQQAVKSFAPLRTEYIRLSYAIASAVESLISEGSGSRSTGNNIDTNTTLLSSTISTRRSGAPAGLPAMVMSKASECKGVPDGHFPQAGSIPPDLTHPLG